MKKEQYWCCHIFWDELFIVNKVTFIFYFIYISNVIHWSAVYPESSTGSDFSSRMIEGWWLLLGLKTRLFHCKEVNMKEMLIMIIHFYTVIGTVVFFFSFLPMIGLWMLKTNLKFAFMLRRGEKMSVYNFLHIFLMFVQAMLSFANYTVCILTWEL